MFDVKKRKALFQARREARRPPAYTRHYLDAYIKYADAPPILREAYAHLGYWRNVPLEVCPEELIAGIIRAAEPAGFHYGGATSVNTDAAEKLAAQDGYGAERRAALLRDLETVEKNAYRHGLKSIFGARELAHIDAHASTSTWFGGHMVADHETILRIGLEGYRDSIRRYAEKHGGDKRGFYQAMDIILDAVACFITRLADAADAAVAANPANESNAECVAGSSDADVAANPAYAAGAAGSADTPNGAGAGLGGILRHIAAKPPETFHQALQLVWIVHYLNGADSFGRFDQYLFPFFERDAQNGSLTRERAKELLVDFWLKIEDAGQIQNMTIGGTDPDGNAAYSDLTLLCLEVTREVAYKGPNLCLRVTEDIPARIWDEALECIGTGIGLPALYNNGIYADALIRSGVPERKARNYCFAGCSQLMVPGESNFVNDIGMFNAAKIFELTLYDGYDPRIGRQVGLHTGRAEAFVSFGSFMEAFLRQLEDACTIQATLHDREIAHRASHEGYALRALFTRGCLESGRPVYEGGANYNNVELEIIGITNAADSLYAIKKAVFDDRRVTLPELCDILRSDWDGRRDLQAYFKSLPKFGNGVVEVDALRAQITEFLYKRFNQTPAPLGGVYVPGEVIFTAHEHCGAVTGATPDGRGAGEVLADSAGGSTGCVREGPTALMDSTLSLPVADYLLTSTVLNMRFLPDLFNGAGSRKKVSALLRGFFSRGGMQLQINVCGSEALRAAQLEPERYGDLVVRVGGYSDYFVRLSRALQNEIIARAAFVEKAA